MIPNATEKYLVMFWRSESSLLTLLKRGKRSWLVNGKLECDFVAPRVDPLGACVALLGSSVYYRGGDVLRPCHVHGLAVDDDDDGPRDMDLRRMT